MSKFLKSLYFKGDVGKGTKNNNFIKRQLWGERAAKGGMAGQEPQQKTLLSKNKKKIFLRDSRNRRFQKAGQKRLERLEEAEEQSVREEREQGKLYRLAR